MLVLLGIGLLLLFTARSHSSFELDYGRLCYDKYYGTNANSSKEGVEWAQHNCFLDFTAHVDLKNPMVYYRLDNFYSNHRTYVKSKSNDQLKGVDQA